MREKHVLTIQKYPGYSLQEPGVFIYAEVLSVCRINSKVLFCFYCFIAGKIILATDILIHGFIFLQTNLPGRKPVINFQKGGRANSCARLTFYKVKRFIKKKPTAKRWVCCTYWIFPVMLFFQ